MVPLALLQSAERPKWDDLKFCTQIFQYPHTFLVSFNQTCDFRANRSVCLQPQNSLVTIHQAGIHSTSQRNISQRNIFRCTWQTISTCHPILFLSTGGSKRLFMAAETAHSPQQSSCWINNSSWQITLATYVPDSKDKSNRSRTESPFTGISSLFPFQQSRASRLHGF